MAVQKQQGENCILTATITNCGNQPYTFKLGGSIGKGGVAWYDIGYYADGYGDYRDITIAANQTLSFTRTIQIPFDIPFSEAQLITDAWMTVKSQDLLIEYAQMVVTDAITVVQPVEICAKITSITVV